MTIKDKNQPNGDIEIKISGLRPGEKLYEELLIGEDNIEPTYHERILTAKEVYLPLDELNKLITQLEAACAQNDCEQIRHLLLNAPTGYHPVSELADFVWKKNQNLIKSSFIMFKKVSMNKVIKALLLNLAQHYP